MVTWLHARRREGETAMRWISSIKFNAWIMEIKFAGTKGERPMLEEEDVFQVYSFTYFWISLLILTS